MNQGMIDHAKLIDLMARVAAELPHGELRTDVERQRFNLEEDLRIEKQLLSERTRKGNETRRARGDTFVRPHLAEAREIAVAVKAGRADAERTELRQILAKQIADGDSYEKMATWLNASRILRRNGKPWTRSALFRILR